MVAKLIVHGRDRHEAIRIMRRALDEFYISPIKTTIPLQIEIMNHPDFVKGIVSTHFLEKMYRKED